jgi:hypothetical protein
MRYFTTVVWAVAAVIVGVVSPDVAVEASIFAYPYKNIAFNGGYKVMAFTHKMFSPP